ncbi:hypothetical protein [Pseudonocardia spirodelae]|uniref:DUF4331 domain-containing protein n=1 Tax=Pseudonocardia spirodelae TaxID=3133431 RepID=A0ABU8T1K9_9PSEU
MTQQTGPCPRVADLFVFRGRRGTVLALTTPELVPGAAYDLRVDGDGDAVEDLTYRIVAEGPDGPDGARPVVLRRMAGAAADDPDACGTVVAAGRTGTTLAGTDGLRLRVGPAAGPAPADPVLLAAVGAAVEHGVPVVPPARDLPAAPPSPAPVTAIVLEVPDAVLAPVAIRAAGRIGVWTTTAPAPGCSGPPGRRGLPLLAEVYAGLDAPLREHLGRGRPSSDRAEFGGLLAKKTERVVAAGGAVGDPRAYARRVADRLLPDVLRYTIGTPACFGFAGWNGRDLGDDAAAVVYGVATGTPVPGRPVRVAGPRPTTTWPYVPLP